MVEGLDGKLRSAISIGSVYFARTAPLDGDERIAHDGGHLDLFVRGIDAEDHDGVGICPRGMQIARIDTEKRNIDDFVR